MGEPFPAWVRNVTIPLHREHLVADLIVPEGARATVVFAHGSGSGRRSPRNRFVADALAREEIASLLLDLLTPAEAEEDERTAAFRFDIPRLGHRLVTAVDWARADPVLGFRPIGLYGASTGGAAALLAAASRPEAVGALVLRGARSDLAHAVARRVRAPTLFLVGGRDLPILAVNRETSQLLAGPCRTTVIPGASHLFEEPGALEAVAKNTAAWFHRHLVEGTGPPMIPSEPGAASTA